MRQYNALGMKLSDALQLAELSRSTYYYSGNGKKKGKRSSATTVHRGKVVSNHEVVIKIKEILEPDFIDYGYKRTTVVLKREGYNIGKSKVYRLMKENGLLNPIIKAAHPGRKFFVYTSPQPDGPFQIIETDFKYVHIYGEKTNGYLITMFDTFHREVYEWGLFDNMKTDTVILLILQLIDNHLLPNHIDPKQIDVIIRSDNGSQFISKKFRELLSDCHIKNQYIPPATPQMNGHIEAFHNTVQKLVCRKYRFESFSHARQVFSQFFETYNNRRIMKAILYHAPTQFRELWKKGLIKLRKENKRNHFYFTEEGMKATPPPCEDCVVHR